MLVAAGCDSQDAQPMNLNETLAKYVDSPVGESIAPVARALVRSRVLVAIQEAPSSEGTISLKVSTDNQERMWAYIYTDESEFSAAFPDGGPYAEMQFSDAFKIVSADRRFGGIFINRKPKRMYLIPREVFPDVVEALAD